MEAKLTNNKTLLLSENGQQLGELIYENLLFLKAEIKLKNSALYEISPVGIFGTKINLTENGTEIANLKMNWRGQIVLAFNDGQEFILKSTGAFKQKFIIEDDAHEQIIQLDPQFNWRKFQYNYDITNNKIPQNNLLILLGVYASNYFTNCMAGMG
jgi:hypothetical protein